MDEKLYFRKKTIIHLENKLHIRKKIRENLQKHRFIDQKTQ